MNEASFAQYNLREELLLALNQKGFTTPTPVQEQVLSLDRFDQDLIVRAKTGSGKTLAFLLPLLQEIEPSTSWPRILVLSPTRELAQQTAKEAEWISRHLDISVATLVGGLDMSAQVRSLRAGAAIVVDAGLQRRQVEALQRVVAGAVEDAVFDVG